jgi:hypothetical protein
MNIQNGKYHNRACQTRFRIHQASLACIPAERYLAELV